MVGERYSLWCLIAVNGAIKGLIQSMVIKLNEWIDNATKLL